MTKRGPSDTFYCVIATQAHPDSQRPFSSTSVTHFQTLEEAEVYTDQVKEDFIVDTLGYINAGNGMYQMDLLDGTTSSLYTRQDIFDQMYDLYYCDSYMDMPPFEVEIEEVNFSSNKK